MATGTPAKLSTTTEKGDRARAGGAVDAVAVGNREDHPQQAVREADPTNGVLRSPGGDQGTHDGEGQEEHPAHRITRGAEDGRVARGQRGSGEDVEHAGGDRHGYGEAGQRP